MGTQQFFCLIEPCKYPFWDFGALFFSTAEMKDDTEHTMKLE